MRVSRKTKSLLELGNETGTKTQYTLSTKLSLHPLNVNDAATAGIVSRVHSLVRERKERRKPCTA